MSLSKVLSRLGASAMLVSVLALGGCTGLTPVYGERGAGAERIALSYGAPTSRLDQIVYQELSLRLGTDAGPSAPRVDITTYSGAGGLTRSRNPSAVELHEATVSATAVITNPSGTVKPIVLTRKASAQYTTNNQTLANNSAFTEASERAAKAAAESLHLAILAALNGTVG